VIELGILVEPRHGVTYDQLLAMAKTAEESGLDLFFRSDHYQGTDQHDESYRPTDSWVTLPGPLAIAVATVDAMSGGRVELGIGTGWYEAEHRRFGVPFPSLAERFDRLEEQLAVITGLWRTPPGRRFSFEGRHYRLEDCFTFPRPAHGPPPIIIGGDGPRRTPRLVARYAAEFNATLVDPPTVRQHYARVRQACEEEGRDPSTLRLSWVAPRVCCGRTEAEIARRREILGPRTGAIPDHGLTGTPEYLAERLAEWVEVGVSRIYVHYYDVTDLDQIALLGEEVAPRLRASTPAAR
jgi:alkanesulfonate monooxygenase SsuD/methylene tetrahydromethanopterin reductase-like flavin-dependent oxidoreductase (luciferase family)